MLKHIASSLNPRVGSNVFWESHINTNEWERIHHDIRNDDDYDDCMSLKFPGKKDISSYRVFATKLEASINRQFIFMSLKSMPEHAAQIVRMSKVSKNVLNVQLQLVSSILEKKKLSKSSDTFRNGMTFAIKLMFNEVLGELENKTVSEAEETIFSRVHLLLENWVGGHWYSLCFNIYV